MKRRIGILGGTFDPIHRGHLDPLLEIAESLEWSRILLIPAFCQPFKAGRETTSACHRFAMAVMAAERDPRTLVSPVEIDRGALSYSVDTLEQLAKEYPDSIFDWVIGDDNVARLDQWHRLDRILELANFVVMRRTGKSWEASENIVARVIGPGEKGTSGSIIATRNQIAEISATDVRDRVRRGVSIESMVDERVADYIRRYSLYV